MENSRLPNYRHERTQRAPFGSEQGFALVSLLAIAPLALAAILTLGAGLYILKRKSLAQAHCVQQASQLQTDLKETLDKLLALNPSAKSLRTQRDIADNALKAALSSLNPYAIAAAEAYWNAVVLQQVALKARQQTLLARADTQRKIAHREMRERLRALKVAHVESRGSYWRSLAVEAKPATSLTPDYEPVPMFERRQEHRFRFEVDLRPPFAKLLPDMNFKQMTECSVSLKGEQHRWKLRVLAANARSNWSWF